MRLATLGQSGAPCKKTFVMLNVETLMAQEDQLEEHHRRDGFEQAQVRPEFMCSQLSSQLSLCCRRKSSAETVSMLDL